MAGYTEKVVVDDREISIETGNWAKQAHGSVVYRTGNLVILATVCAEKEAKEGQEFFPLTVDYREKIYAVGRIPGGYIKRENRPGEHETLISRLIDRPVRPLFPEGYYSEVQLLLTVISADDTTTTEGHAITAASAALCASDIPFHGPVAGVVVGRVNGEFIADPGASVLKTSDLELIVAGSKDAIIMIEGGAQEFSNEEILGAIEFAHENIKKKLAFQESLAKATGVVKREVSLRLPDPEMIKELREFAKAKMEDANRNPDKAKRSADVDAVYDETVAHFKEKYADHETLDALIKQVKEQLHVLEADVVRDLIFDKGVRADGRKTDEIRDISVELDVLPGVHGSSVFTRGQTQSLGVVTLGTAGDYQRYENLAGQHQKHFMLHYNFPPYSTGEVKRMSGPGRREIGHGNLAERALRYVVPDQETFPYVIRVVSEILESNGSSSMASVCSGSLSLMTSGVPIKKAVSGIAMGLIMSSDSKNFVVLSDIAGLEDHFGDMDFKVAGSEDGITAFQLDIKVSGISLEILRTALLQAEKGRMHILSIMNQAIDKPRESVPTNAPRITTVQIDPDRIGELIGPGGKIIRSIIERSGAELNVEDSGVVTIAALSTESAEIALKMVNDLFKEVEAGEEYTGQVKRITDFGAFIEIFPGKEGLLHISKMADERVNAVRDLYNEGDTVEVVVLGVDRQGRIDLASKAYTQSAPSHHSHSRGHSSNRSDRPREHREHSGERRTRR